MRVEVSVAVPKTKRKRIVRPRFREVSVRDLLDASDVPCLRDEMSEWRDNIEEKFSGTSKFEEVSECADTLDYFADYLENNVGELIASLEKTEVGQAVLGRLIKVRQSKLRQSRSDRAAEVQGSIEAALEIIRAEYIGGRPVRGEVDDLDPAD